MNRPALFTPVVILAAVVFGAAQQNAQPAVTPSAAPQHYYRLNYVVKELDDSKVVNQRSYTLTTTADTAPGGEWTRLRAGTRLPVITNENNKDVSYIDVGVNIDNRLKEVGDLLSLEVTAEISSVASDNKLGNPPHDAAVEAFRPSVRQVKGTMQAIIGEGKPATVFTADDPASRHRFELDVTAIREH